MEKKDILDDRTFLEIHMMQFLNMLIKGMKMTSRFAMPSEENRKTLLSMNQVYIH